MTRAEVSLREARPEDAAAIAEIWQVGWRDGHLGLVPDALALVRTDESFRTRASERIGDTTVATVAEVVAGFVMVVESEVEQVYVGDEAPRNRCRRPADRRSRATGESEWARPGLARGRGRERSSARLLPTLRVAGRRRVRLRRGRGRRTDRRSLPPVHKARLSCSPADDRQAAAKMRRCESSASRRRASIAPPNVRATSWRGARVGNAIGGEQIGAGLFELDEGERSFPYHFHHGNEEWLLVVAGSPTRADAGGRATASSAATSSAFRSGRPARTRSPAGNGADPFREAAPRGGRVSGQRQGRSADAQHQPELPRRRRGRLLGGRVTEPLNLYDLARRG